GMDRRAGSDFGRRQGTWRLRSGGTRRSPAGRERPNGWQTPVIVPVAGMPNHREIVFQPNNARPPGMGGFEFIEN
ncbi:MAG TPA: hypothetical protein VJX66_14565, partial [Amycolatopsis sp.]|nr:hypothetical protein [Amycolatopsis sp.]